MAISTNRIRRRAGTMCRPKRRVDEVLIFSLFVLALPLFANQVVADLRGDNYQRKSFGFLSGWVDFEQGEHNEKESSMLFDDMSEVRHPRSSRRGIRMLGTMSSVEIGISGISKGKGKGRGKSKSGSSKSSKGKGGSKSSSSDLSDDSDCDNIFAQGKGGKGKGGKGSSKSGRYDSDDYEYTCDESHDPTPTDGTDSTDPTTTTPTIPTPAPVVAGFPIFSESPFSISEPTLAEPTLAEPTLAVPTLPSRPTGPSPTVDTPTTVAPVELPTSIREPTATGPRCNVGPDGLFGSQLGLAEETEFAYQTTVSSSVTSAELEAVILQRIENGMAPLVLGQLFSRCRAPGSTAQQRLHGRWLRKLQAAEIEGWSTLPRDLVAANVPCVEVESTDTCFVIRGKATAYAEGKISDATRQSVSDAIRLAIETGNLKTADNRLVDVTYRDLDQFPIPDTDPGDGTQDGNNGSGNNGGDGRGPNDLDGGVGGVGGDDDGLAAWVISLIAVAGSVTLCLAYLCLRRPSHSSLDVDDESSSSSSSSSSESSSSSSSESEKVPLKSTPEPPAPLPERAPTPEQEPEPEPSAEAGEGLRLVKVIKRASRKQPDPAAAMADVKISTAVPPKPDIQPIPEVPTITVEPVNADFDNMDTRNEGSATPEYSVGSQAQEESTSGGEASDDQPIPQPSPVSRQSALQQSAFSLDMGEDLRDAASGLTTDLEFSNAEFGPNEGFVAPPIPFGSGSNPPSSYDPSSSSYEEVVEEYEIEYDEDEDFEDDVANEVGSGYDDDSEDVFWDEELNDVDQQNTNNGGAFI